jgi:hypothetical protein
LSQKKDLLLEVDVKKATDLLKQKHFEYGFIAKGFFLWRDIDPLSDFSISDLANSVEQNIKSREAIDYKSLRTRVNSAIVEYLEVKNNSEFFTFIENISGNLDYAINKFSLNFVPVIIS